MLEDATGRGARCITEMASGQTDVAVEIRGITKRFGTTLANDCIDLDIRRGEIHALLGENGAGKSTLMNILYGLYRPDAGSIHVNGRRVEINSPRDAAALGIQMVHQHFMLGLPFSVAENLVLGLEPLEAGFLLDRRKAEAVVRALSKQYGLDVDPRARVESLSVGVRQRVEILKALYRGAQILILDEPTTVLAPLEIAALFKVMRRLKAEGKTVIFITHKLREVMAVADQVTVLRHGRVIGTRLIDEVDEDILVEMAVGRLVEADSSSASTTRGEIVLRVQGLHAVDPHRGVEVLCGINLEVRAGEILGIAGIEGNGQSELVEVLTGLRPAAGGSICLDGTELVGRPPRWIMEHGLVCIHEDRQSRGLVGDFTVSENLVLGEQCHPHFRRGPILDAKAVLDRAQQLVRDFDIRPPRPDMQAKYLSGGNQQKLVTARELSTERVRLLVASQPCHGLDVPTTIFIHRKLREKRDAGTAVLLLSADLDEVKLLSDHIAVIHQGKIVATGPTGTFSDAELGALMLRGQPEAEASAEPL